VYKSSRSGLKTNLGNIKRDLFKLHDEDLAINDIVAAAEVFLEACTDDEKSKVCYHIDSPEWRTWSNPEFLLSDKGVRLDECPLHLRVAVLDVLRASLSPEGYKKAISAMRINHFLGELVEAPRIMNEYSYNFVLFGMPSASRPWGFQLYGHHLCLNIFLYRRQIVISPWFTGAEPNFIDTGPYAGTRILHEEERLGLELMQGLSPQDQNAAQIYKDMHDAAMSEGRWNADDQRHLCGAYRDNSIVPYEGVVVSSLSDSNQNLVWQILEQYLTYLPSMSRRTRIEQCKHFAHETFFSWIGSFGSDDPFYYRIQSPIVVVEFDHHSGVFLTNEEPAKFHIHTLLRTPNAGDYGMALRPLIPPAQTVFKAIPRT